MASGRVLGYTRVSTDEQRQSGLGLEAQHAAITTECERRGWNLVELFTDAGASGSSVARRPGLQKALKVLQRQEADTLVVAKLDRLSRSLLDFAALMEQARRQGWALVALDLGLDMTSPSGEMLASVMASFAQYERRLIGQRTRDALAIKRAQGVALGRPRELDAGVVRRVQRLRRGGKSFRAIADTLNAAGVPTAHGGKRWHASTVQAVVRAGVR